MVDVYVLNINIATETLVSRVIQVALIVLDQKIRSA